jgi:hypothetical protein
MNPLALQLAAELGGSVLSAPGGGLVLVERLQGHGLPQVLVLGRGAADLAEALAGLAAAQARGVALNGLALVPLSGSDLTAALDLHRRRLGALVCALDAGPPWLDGKPMLARRLPGRLFRAEPAAMPPAPMGPLERAQLEAFLPGWEPERITQVFRQPLWRAVEGGVEADLWPGVPPSAEAELRVPPLSLPEATALTDALRAALRAVTGQPIPFLPLPADPAPLHALRTLTPAATAFRGPARAWDLAFGHLAQLPAPPHFCARC